MKDEIKKATELAENELQEKRIENFKNIIKNLLQKKLDKEKEKDELESEIKLIKQDIDDFKVGRLDKIKERHELDPKANSVAPINITIINDNHRTIYPLQPWKWNYEIYWSYPLQTFTGASWTTNSAYLTNSLTNVSNGGAGSLGGVVTLCGTNAVTYTTGAYNLGTNGNDIINL